MREIKGVCTKMMNRDRDNVQRVRKSESMYVERERKKE